MERQEILEVLTLLCQIQKTYSDLYKKNKYITGMYKDSIQIDEGVFFELFSDNCIKVYRDTTYCPYEYYVIFNGVKINCITDINKEVGVKVLTDNNEET